MGKIVISDNIQKMIRSDSLHCTTKVACSSIQEEELKHIVTHFSFNNKSFDYQNNVVLQYGFI